MLKANSIIALLLLVVLCTPICVWLKYQHVVHKYKATVQQRLASNETVTFTLATNDVIWVKKGKEILHQNKMFDVKKITIKGDSALITGWYDDEETNANSSFNQLKKAKKILNNQLIQLLQLQYCEPLLTLNYLNFRFTNKVAIHFFYLQKKQTNFYKQTLKPPIYFT